MRKIDTTNKIIAMANSVLSFVVKNQPDTMYELNNNTGNNSFLKKHKLFSE